MPLLGLVLFSLPPGARGQAAAGEPIPAAGSGIASLRSMADSLPLDTAAARALRQAIDGRDYPSAEGVLIAEINKSPHSKRAARLLAYAGSVYFLNQDFLNAAIAWKKSDAISPLDTHLQFSLAMAYMRISRPDWARKQLESLTAQDPTDALYPYWLGRIEYDAQQFSEAIAHFQHAIALDPAMARAYDNLGLCYYRNNLNDQAIASFKKAIELDKTSPHPSAWPYLNLAITQQFVDQISDAETNLREALRLDPDFAQAHFQLGCLLETLGRLDAAIVELKEAVRLNPDYLEPHIAMARIYKQLGKKSEAQEEVKIYLRLRPHGTP